MNTARLLVVEDEAVLRLTFKQFLEEKGYEVWTAVNFDEAVARLDETPIDVVVSDIILGGKTGIDLLRAVEERGLDCMSIMITGNPSVETASQSVRLGAFDYLTKPVTDNDLERVVRLALDKKKVAAERDAYRRELDVIFNSVNAGIITVDKDLCVCQVNDAARAMFKLSSERSNGCAFEDLLPASLGQVREALQRTLMTQERETDIRLEVSMNSDPDKVLAITTAPLVGSRGAQEGAVLIARDITRLTFLERELQDKHRYRDMVGKSRQILEIFKLIEDLAETDSTVLICGESGTGKELVAEAIHRSSTRSQGPFVRVNCAALSEDILDSELFGHVKGAFTGAIRDRMGRFESADGGTILLDEIGDVSPRLQLRLLRVLQEGEFERVGDSNTIRSDVRVVASTNQDLIAKINSGEFRQDLYYRLNVIKIDIPPLRQRKEDIPILVDHFLRRFNTTMKKEISSLSPEALSVLMNFSWHGNIRELENCIERAFIVCHDTTILPEHLPEEILKGNELPRSAFSVRAVFPNVEKISKEAVIDVLAQTDWNVAKSARLLGIARNTLYEKMKAMGLSRPN